VLVSDILAAGVVLRIARSWAPERWLDEYATSFVATRVALVAVAVNERLIWYGQSARSHGVALAAAVLSFLVYTALWREEADARPGRLGSWPPPRLSTPTTCSGYRAGPGPPPGSHHPGVSPRSRAAIGERRGSSVDLIDPGSSAP
jgi:hypothetical protein